MLSDGGGEPHLWAIVAAVTASMGHRCGCQARLSSIDVPSLLKLHAAPELTQVYYGEPSRLGVQY